MRFGLIKKTLQKSQLLVEPATNVSAQRMQTVQCSSEAVCRRLRHRLSDWKGWNSVPLTTFEKKSLILFLRVSFQLVDRITQDVLDTETNANNRHRNVNLFASTSICDENRWRKRMSAKVVFHSYFVTCYLVNFSKHY